MSRAINAAPMLLALALLVYPVLFYLLADAVGVAWLGVLLAVLVLGRVLAARQIPLAWRAAAAGAVLGYVALAAYFESGTLLKLYPVAINAALLGWGIFTLRHPPSAIERVVLRLSWPVSDAGRRYMRTVTMIWCGYFAVNGSVAAFTALAAPTVVWAWYNGVVSYVMAGVLFGTELAYRGVYRRRHTPVGPAPGG